MGRNQRAAIHNLMILLNNLQLFLAADDIQNGLRDQISWFCEQIEVMFGFLVVYYSEEGCSSDHHHHHHHVAGESASSEDDEVSRVVGMVRDFAAEFGNVVVDVLDETIAKQLHTTCTNRTVTVDEDDEPLVCNDDHPAAAAIGVPELRERVNSIVRHIYTCNNDVEYYRKECKKAAEDSAQLLPSLKNEYWIGDGIPPIGFHSYMSTVETRLLGNMEEQLDVIAIMGEGGTGKTTLAKLVSLAGKFGIVSCGWISVSKAYVLRDLLLSLLGDIMVIADEIYEMEDWELKNKLREQLKGRRYLIVLDDVWDIQAWDDLKDVFINTGYTRILITTRSSKVAFYATRRAGKTILPEHAFGKHYPFEDYKAEKRYTEMMSQYDCFELKPLNPKGSFTLFYQLYFLLFCEECQLELEFSDDEDEVPVSPKRMKNYDFKQSRGFLPQYYSFLEKEVVCHGRKIVNSCCGRPLVISVVARILCAIDRDDGISTWSRVAGEINEELSGDYEKQMDILTLCFHKLPQHLQSCFLYLAVFPEDTEISAKQLIQLWIAEGLIGLPTTPQGPGPEDNDANRTMEDVAEDCLENLIALGLIQVSGERLDRRAKSCNIHDLLRDFCIRLSNEQGSFLEVHTGGDHSSTGTDRRTKPKILSVVGNCKEYLSKSKHSADSCSHVRSFFSFSQDTQSFLKEDWESLFKHLKRLRVLNLGEQEVKNKLDDSIEELVHLRYLKVKPAKNITLPISAIFNLWNLQTIDLRRASFSKLPVEIWKMQQLRHLYLGGRLRLPKARNEDYLPNLFTLSYISNDPRHAIRIAKKAPNLRKLGLKGYHCASKEEQKATFDLLHLQSLKFAQECTFKETITLPETITKITVKGAVLRSDAIEMFGNLPNLQILKLQTNFYDEKFEVLRRYSFPSLQLLQLAVSNIVTWTLEEGAMQKLNRLVLRRCPQLTKLPDQLWDPFRVRKLELLWCSEELADNIPHDIKTSEHFDLVFYPPRPDA